MNAVTEQRRAPRECITPAVLDEARKQAQASRRPLVEVLEEQVDAAPADFTAALAGLLGFEWLSNEQLHSLTAAFDVLPFAEASSHECIAFRDENDAMLVAIGDPFSLDLQAWASERVRPAGLRSSSSASKRWSPSCVASTGE